MKTYRCNVCGWIYDPAKGDPEHGVPAGTPWEKVPADWICPKCGVGKEEFEEEK
ncbi:MAG: rubredoxin [Deltaproteobacteria bacterium]|jgi:rubredoxin|nr:rubredoxin [Deltaproteobacteria bacterium]